MQLNLNNLLEEIYSWKTLLRRKDGEIEHSRNQMAKLCKQNKILEEKHKTMLLEISEFNDVLSSLHTSISKSEDCEVNKRLLASENKRLENCIEDLKKLQLKEREDMKREVEQIKSNCKKEIETELMEFESKVSAKQRSYLTIIKDKDKRLSELEDEISKLKVEREQDILKLKIEYEEMISKMKNRLLKIKVSHPCQDNYHKDDIFRQKYMKLEKNSREETEQLKTQVKELQSEIDTLRSQNAAAARNFIQKSTPINNHQYSEGSRNFDEDNSHQSKRFRAEPADENDDFTKLKSKNSCVELVRPVKKKLFNLDFNYFNMSKNTHRT